MTITTVLHSRAAPSLEIHFHLFQIFEHTCYECGGGRVTVCFERHCYRTVGLSQGTQHFRKDMGCSIIRGADQTIVVNTNYLIPYMYTIEICCTILVHYAHNTLQTYYNAKSTIKHDHSFSLLLLLLLLLLMVLLISFLLALSIGAIRSCSIVHGSYFGFQ